jgi:hypothetical protein
MYMLNVCAKQYIIVIQYAIPKWKQNSGFSKILLLVVHNLWKGYYSMDNLV